MNINCRSLQRRKERGRIAVESVHVVETASLGNNSTGGGGGGGIGDVAGGDAGGGGGGIPSGLPFQVGYREAGQEYTLYLLAAREQDRAEWIRAIRAGKSSVSLQLSPFLSSPLGRFSRVRYSSATWFARFPAKRVATLADISSPAIRCQSRFDKRVSSARRDCDICFDISRRGRRKGVETPDSR